MSLQLIDWLPHFAGLQLNNFNMCASSVTTLRQNAIARIETVP
jgi:hypothetical protein